MIIYSLSAELPKRVCGGFRCKICGGFIDLTWDHEPLPHAIESAVVYNLQVLEIQRQPRPCPISLQLF
jgi:hypothetical protein